MKSYKKYLIILICLILAAALAVFVTGKYNNNKKDENDTGISYSSPEEVAKEYMQASVKGDAQKVMSIYPGKYKSYLVSHNFGGDESKAEESVRKDLIANASENEGVLKAAVDYKIIEVKDAGGNYRDYLLDWFEKAGIGKIEEVKEVEVEVTRKEKGNESTVKTNVYAAKLGGKWYYVGKE